MSMLLPPEARTGNGEDLLEELPAQHGLERHGGEERAAVGQRRVAFSKVLQVLAAQQHHTARTRRLVQGERREAEWAIKGCRGRLWLGGLII